MEHQESPFAQLCAEAWNDDEFRFDIKAQDIAVDLARAVAESGLSRAQLAEALGWKPSRISRVLGSGSNLTIRTIHQITNALGLDFDVVLRRPEQQRPAQPWEYRDLLCDVGQLHQLATQHVVQTKALLDTARQLNRRSWKNAQTFSGITGGTRYTALPSAAQH